MRRLGIEPRQSPWKGEVLTIILPTLINPIRKGILKLFIMPSEGFEPSTSRLGTCDSIRAELRGQCGREDSNLRTH